MERGAGRDPPSRLRELIGERTSSIVFTATALALLVRLDGLGDRVAHWDEGRVGYDILRYAETGVWEYRPIVHGPFLPHVNEVVFSVLGPSDFSMRLVVAIVGGLLPMAPWLFRRHLRDVEMIGATLFLAFDPLLVYYSRFMRNDVLVAAFMLFALGLFVRFFDTRRVRYLYAAFGVAALGFTAKENAVVYVVCWIGAGALLGLESLLRTDGRPTRESVAARIASAIKHVRARVGDADDPAASAGYYGAHFVAALGLAALVLVYFYAPRTGGAGVGLERLAGRPDLFPAIAQDAFADFRSGITDWGTKSTDGRGYDSPVDRFRDYLERFLGVLAAYSPGLVLFALAGIVRERFVVDRPRPIVLAFSYWGLVSVPGYALGMDIWAAWGLVHAIVPLSVPAGVAVGRVFDWGLEAAEDLGRAEIDRGVDAALSVSVVAVLVLSMLTVGAGTAFDPANTRSSGESHVVQYAQPNQDLRETVGDVEAVVDETGDPVVFYADEYAIDNESAAYRPPVESRWEEANGSARLVEDNGNWYRRLPLPWYLERAGAERLSARDRGELDAILREENPVVIITMREHDGENNKRVVDARADGYVSVVHEMRSPGTETVFYLRTDALESVRGERASDDGRYRDRVRPAGGSIS